MEIGDKVIANKIYGNGEVVNVYSEGMISIKFENNKLPIMCSSRSMETIHSGEKAKFKKDQR